MIFVTVGTHEQQFNRLIRAVDELKAKNIIKEDVIMQTGFSNYTPKYCSHEKLMSYDVMQKNIREARIVITHGGPASFIAALQQEKIPIVVPRQKKYNEHINNHQLEFCKTVKERMGTIILVEDIENLQETIENYDIYTKNIKKSNTNNNIIFSSEVEELVKKW